MGYWVDENTYQYDSDEEMMNCLGIDPETMQGDYSEAYQHWYKKWEDVKNDLLLEDK